MAKFITKLLLVVGLIILVGLFFILDVGQYLTLENLKNHQEGQ